MPLNHHKSHGVTLASAALMTVAALVGLAACSNGPAPHSTANRPHAPSQTVLAPAQPGSLNACEALASGFRFEQTVIDSAQAVAAGTVQMGSVPVAAHCLVKGRMHPRKGIDGRDYAIGFEMRLPQAWSGRFFFQGNGGLDGAVVPALGLTGGGPVTGALAQGFAVISSDAGHTLAQTAVFGLEPQARYDYAYQATIKLTPMAKALIAAAYGRGPDRSYIGGCSNGGRHTMIAAARLGDAYDGYLAGAPGSRLALASLANNAGVPLWQPLMTAGATKAIPGDAQGRTMPDLETAFTPRERRVVAQALRERCDALDGTRDGMVLAVQACQKAFDLNRDVPTCAGTGPQGRNGQCLSVQQKQVLAQVQAGVKLRDGQTLYLPFLWDTAIESPDWADWRFNNAMTRGPLGSSTIFSVPPTAIYEPFSLDVDARRRMQEATSERFPQSVSATMSMPDFERPASLRPLWDRGARMIIYHGTGDPIFSAEESRQWIDRLQADQRARGAQPGADPARLFWVPGMAHCRGGASADQFDLLAPLVQWVEYGVAPKQVVASVRAPGNRGGANPELPADWSANRTRPLCAWPQAAHYKGQGSVEQADSFECR